MVKRKNQKSPKRLLMIKVSIVNVIVLVLEQEFEEGFGKLLILVR
jgi:hypothetical protein